MYSENVQTGTVVIKIGNNKVITATHTCVRRVRYLEQNLQQTTKVTL